MMTVKKNKQAVIIFTDLDGTLLDHDDYSFVAAAGALEDIADHRIPLIINSSKTFAEIIAIQKKLAIHQPFICENGAAVYLPITSRSDSRKKSWRCQVFASSYNQVVNLLKKIRDKHGFEFVGFSDCDVKGISDLTGLSLTDAKLAAKRDFSEPLLWHDSEDNKKEFISMLHEKGFIAQQGGRFLSVMKQANKAEAMQWLCQYLMPDKKPLVIALGDSPNDEQMLNAADIAVVIKSDKSEKLKIVGSKKVIKTRLRGPAGWQRAMDKLLPDLI